MAWRRSVVAVLPALVLAAACSAQQAVKVDTSPIVAPITAKVNEVGVRVDKIDCPTDVDARAGATFSCTVRTDKGEAIPVTVTQKEESGQLKLAWQLGNDLVIPDRFIGDLTSYARSTVSGDLTVSCPKSTVVAGGNGTLTCTVRDAAGTEAKLVVPLAGGAPVPDKAQWSIQQ